MKLNLKRPLAFFDLETTGLAMAKDRIVEIAILKVNVNNRIEEKSWLINPEMHIPPESTAIHKITDEMVKGKPTFKQVAHDILNFLGNADLAGYNIIKFDVPFLAEEFAKANIDFDVEKRKLLDVQNIYHKMEPRTLKAAYKFYCGSDIVDAHEALGDARSTYQVLLAQLERYEGTDYEDPHTGIVSQPIVNDIDKLSDFTCKSNNVDLGDYIIYNSKGIATFNFGKHKGIEVNEVFRKEPQYYDWMMKGTFPEQTKKILTRLYTEFRMAPQQGRLF